MRTLGAGRGPAFAERCTPAGVLIDVLMVPVTFHLALPCKREVFASSKQRWRAVGGVAVRRACCAAGGA